MAAFIPCADAHLEHGDCAAQESGDVLRDAGFPMEKFPRVAAAGLFQAQRAAALDAETFGGKAL